MKNQEIIVAIIVVVAVLVILYNINDDSQNKPQNNKEGFEDENLESIERRLVNDISKRLDNKSKEELKELTASLMMSLNKFGISSGSDAIDHSQFALKNDLLEQYKCTVSIAEDRDKYLHKSDIPDQGPQVDMSKYVLKSSIPPETVCPPPKEVDLSKYLLKSSIPPKQECPACICPKVKVSAGLCKKCPPPPKCPPPQPCEQKICPEPAPCPQLGKCPEVRPCPTQKEKVRYDVKYIKVPTVVSKTVSVNEDCNSVSDKGKSSAYSKLLNNYFKNKNNVPAKTEPKAVSGQNKLSSPSESISKNAQQSGEGPNNATYDSVDENDRDKVVMSYNVSQKTPVCMNAELNSAYKKSSEGVYGYPF
jgi:hypothetical protein